MQYTSGTTGLPQRASCSRTAGIGNDGFWIGEGQKLTAAGPGDVCRCRLFHCFGCVLGVMACVTHALHDGHRRGLFAEASAWWRRRSIKEQRHRGRTGCPRCIMAVVELKPSRRFDSFDLSSLRTGIMAGSGCAPETPYARGRWSDMNLRELTIRYGLTEAAPRVDA